MKTRKILYFIFILLTALALPSGSVTSDAADGKQLIFAGDDDYAPYCYADGNTPSGYSVDLIQELAKSVYSFAARDITIKLMPWETCLEELKTGNVDGLIGVPVYGKSLPFLEYSKPIATIEFAIFVDSTNTYINSIKSLEGTIVSVERGSVMSAELAKSGRIQLIETDSVPDALQKLLNHEAKAAVVEKDAALFCIKKEKIEGLKIAGPSVGPAYSYSLAVRKGDTKLVQDINLGISALDDNGTLSRLQTKWFGIRFVTPFPWTMVIFATSGMSGLILLFAGAIWVISLNATINVKTEQIHLMSQKMMEKDKLAVLGKMAGQIAHELRTPMSIIHNSVFLLRKEGSANKELFEKRLQTLEDKIRLSSNILESILSYSRVKAEISTNVSVKECLGEVISDIAFPPGMEKEISFENDSDLNAFIDFHQLYSVLRNIILNAIQAMGKEGKLTVKVFSTNDNSFINVRICDTGPGIPEGAEGKIFTLFYSSKITGTGLGLSISKSIVETNGGQLILESTSKHGTCFLIKLPVSNIAVR